MILNEIHFCQNGHTLKLMKMKTCPQDIIVELDGEQILRVSFELAPLIGDCLSHIGKETDFLGLRAHYE